MANRIKGIIVEIGGDTSNLSAALKGLDSDISKTQSQLRDVNKLLKLDPHNTELLAQKHKLLAQAVDDTSKRLKELKDARKAAESNLKNYDDWKNAVKPVQDEIDKTSSKLNNLKKQRDEMEKAGDVNSDAYKALQTQIDETSNRLDELKKRQKEINEQFGHPISPEQYDSLKREIIDTENKLKDLESQARKSFDAIAAIGDAGKALKDVGDKITGIGTALAPLSGAAAAGLGAATKAAIDYETAFTGVMKTNDELIDENGNVIVSYEDLSDAIKELPTETAASKSDIAAVMEGAGQLGVGTEYLADFTKAMVMLGDTTNLSADEASTAIAKFANITNMSLDNADRLGATLVDLGNNFATDEQSIMEMATRLAGAGHQIGLTEAQILGFATALSSVGIEAEMGGSAFSKAMIKMQVATETGYEKTNEALKKMQVKFPFVQDLEHLQQLMENYPKDFREMADAIGMSKSELTNLVKAGIQLQDFAEVSQMDVDTFVELFRTDAPAALEAFIHGLGDTDTAGESTIQMLQDMGFTEVRLRDTLTRAASAQDLFSNAVQAGTDAWNENTALTAEAEKRYGTTEAKISQVRETVSNLAIDLGELLLPIISDILDRVKEVFQWINGQDENTKKIIVTVGLIVAAMGPLLIVIGNVVSTVGGLLAALPAVSAAFGGWVVPVGLAVAAIAALTGAISDGLGVSLDDMATMAKDVMGRIVDGILTGLPRLADAAVKTMRGFADYLKANLPALMKSGLEITLKLVQSIRENAGKLVDGALNLAKALAKGLADSIPVIIQNVPAIVSSIAGVINDNAPKILMAGIEIIWTLVKGILDSIPVIIENIPQIIKAIVDVITAFNWLNLGANIITWMKNGINTLKTAIPDALHSIGDTAKNLFKNIKWGELGSSVVNAIKSGITGLFKAIPDTLASIANAAKEAFTSIDWKQIGIDLLQGIWNGIKSIASGLLGYVGNFVSDIMDKFTGKEGFDENSPSKWAKKVGSYVPVGLADGFAESTRLAENAASKTVKAVESSFDFSRLSALSQIAVASTSPVKAALSAPLPSTYPNTAAYQNAVRGQYSPVSGVPAQTLRQTPIEISVNNIIGGERVARLQYRYTADEANRRGPSLVKV